jgi:hypothetical protein
MKHKRSIIGFILILMLFTLMLYYSLDHNNHDPGAWYIIDHFEQFNRTKVVLSGEVKNVDKTNNTLLVQVYPSPEALILVSTTENVSTIHQGDIVEMYGLFTSRNNMTAEKLLITEKWKDDLIYLRSLPAIPFALYLFFRTYWFNPDTRRFERRKNHA